MIVDRYGDHLVLQTLTLAMDRRKAGDRASAGRVLHPRRSSSATTRRSARPKGWNCATGVLLGEDPGAVPIEAGGLWFEVDLLRGQKTGFYLDQRDNYAAVAALAKGKRVLDCFSNQGAFALACARAGAQEVTAVEISADATESIRKNAQAQWASGRTRSRRTCSTTWPAQERRTQRWDLIILDPPSFTKSKEKLGDALRGYKEIHLRALKLLNPDGLLATYCCSHHVNRGEFRGIINEATVDAKRTLRQLAMYSQGADHPIISTIPETEYLKGVLFELVPGR